ncbi:hypothetical protein [Paenibacillus protaetiae]|uniref:hypothetical protein n=1 Tax=Paenibacillus protaetiae TaxID=2509456 RepID=UPI0026AA64CA
MNYNNSGVPPGGQQPRNKTHPKDGLTPAQWAAADLPAELHSQTVGERGPVLEQDNVAHETLQISKAPLNGAIWPRRMISHKPANIIIRFPLCSKIIWSRISQPIWPSYLWKTLVRFWDISIKHRRSLANGSPAKSSRNRKDDGFISLSPPVKKDSILAVCLTPAKMESFIWSCSLICISAPGIRWAIRQLCV